MIEVRIDDIESLIRELNVLPNHFVYRGQANADWAIESSLERTIGPKWSKENAKKFEDFSLQQFQSKFHLYDSENVGPDSKLGWLAIMQHYGVPTRLVDFTESPYVALYFALENYSPQGKHDLSVFAIDYTATMERSLGEIKKHDGNFAETRETLHGKRDLVFEEVVDRFSYDIAWITEPRLMNARLDRQSGSFVLSGNSGNKIQLILGSDVYADVKMIKFRIAHPLYQQIFALLRKMNITSKSLYGNLDGLARSIRMEMLVRSV